jgi:hypothetical protein
MMTESEMKMVSFKCAAEGGKFRMHKRDSHVPLNAPCYVVSHGFGKYHVATFDSQSEAKAFCGTLNGLGNVMACSEYISKHRLASVYRG